MAARMKNIRTAVAFDIPVDEASQIANAATRRKYSLRKRSIVPTTNNMAQLARRSSLAVRKASIALANKELLDEENDTDESWKKAPKKTKVNFAESNENDVVIEINQKKKVAFDAEATTTEETTEESDIEAEGANYVKSHHRKPTGMPLVTVNEDEDDEEETDFDKTSTTSADDEEGHHKQDWSKVEPVAWVLLITISIECFIEGIAFSLTLKNAFGAGIAFLTAMLIKLVPQKLGDAVILSNAGLNHLWENLLSLFAVLTVYLGVVFGMAFAQQLKAIQVYFFAALSGIFLYISLASLFPVLQTIIEDTDGLDDIPNDEEFHKAHQKQEMRRLGLANLGFFVAMGLVLERALIF